MNNENKYALELKGIYKSFSNVNVLIDISMKIKNSNIFGIVGENGAGKSTLMNIIGGVVPPSKGEVYLNGELFEPKDPVICKKAGIAFIHQELNLFGNLTVAENLYLNDLKKFVNYKDINNKTKENLKQIKVDDIKPTTLVETLTMGQKQLVEITKAIASNANIIIFDEPTTSLSIKEKELLFNVMRDLKNKGKTIIFISHILDDIFLMCDEISVIRDGKTIIQKEKDELSKNEVISAMVGRELNKIYPTINKKIGKKIFEVRNLSSQNRFKNINLTLHEKEIVGLYGLMGAGRTELLNCLFGLEPVISGEIIFMEKKIKKISPINCIKNELAYVTEDRRAEGLMINMSVKENIVITSLKTLSSGSIFRKINTIEEEKISKNMVKELNIKTFDANIQKTINLSGGNQQKVVLAKWIAKHPKIIFLDEPTRGVDVGAKYEIYTIINELVNNNSAVLMVSSEMEELMGMCDRIMVMSNNKIISEFKKDEYNQEDFMLAAIGGKINE